MEAQSEGATPLRAVVWRRHLDNASLEYALLSRLAGGYEIRGDIVAAHEGAPLRVSYALRCDPDWRSIFLRVEQHWAAERAGLILRLDADRAWRINDTKTDALADCLDIDLGLSPSTNALPINRLRPEIGETVEISAAWVRFPNLDVVPARQSYERRAKRTYRYRSLSTDFQADLRVDDLSLPTRYAGVWKRIAERSYG